MAEGAFGYGWSSLFPPAESCGMGSQPANHQSGHQPDMLSLLQHIEGSRWGRNLAGISSIMFGDLSKHDRVARFHTLAVEQDEE